MNEERASALLETIRIEAGKAQHLKYHNRRFNASRKALFGIEEKTDLSSFISPPDGGLYRCRIIYDHSIRRIEYLPYTPMLPHTIALAESDIDYSHKYAERKPLADLYDTVAVPCDDILVIKEGLLTDTTIANIAFRQGGRWYTPEKPLLNGTTRQRLTETGFLTPREIAPDEIGHFDGFALMNAMLGFAIVNPKWIPLKNQSKVK